MMSFLNDFDNDTARPSGREECTNRSDSSSESKFHHSMPHILPSTAPVPLRSRMLWHDVRPLPGQTEFVHIGNHSVVTNGTLPVIVAMDESGLSPAPLALTKVVHYIEFEPLTIDWDCEAEHYILISGLLRSTLINCHPHPTEMNLAVRIPAQAGTFLPTSIDFVGVNVISNLPPTVFDSSLIGKNVNSEILKNVLACRLLYKERTVASMLAGAFQLKSRRYDNMALYAKLWYYCLGEQMLAETEGGLDAPPSWNNVPVEITLNVAEEATALQASKRLVEAIRDGRIVLLQDEHFTAEDRTVLWTLAASGNRFNPLPDVRQFPHQTFVWPAIFLTLVYRGGPLPDAVINTRPGAYEFRRVALSLASTRGEVDDCVRGYYYAADLIASGHVAYLSKSNKDADPNQTDLPDPIPEPDINIAVTPYHECHGVIVLPKPRDMNFLVRLAVKMEFQIDPLKAVDYQTLQLTRLSSLLYAAIALGGITSAMTTTANYSIQLTGSDLQGWRWVNVSNTRSNYMLKEMWLSKGYNKELPLLFESVLKLMADCCGYSKPADYLLGRSWGAQSLQVDTTLAPWLFGIGHGFKYWSYHWGNLLAISEFLTLRPLEWGICNPNPICSFNEDIKFNKSSIGWFSRNGDDAYCQRVRSGTPYAVVTYGAFAANVICQYFEWKEAPVLYGERSTANNAGISSLDNCGVYSYGSDGPLFQDPAILPAQPPYDVVTHSFWPCTIMSYYHETSQIVAICLEPQPILDMKNPFRTLMRIAGKPMPNAGLRIVPSEVRGYSAYSFQPRGIFARVGGRLLPPSDSTFIPNSAGPIPVVAGSVTLVQSAASKVANGATSAEVDGSQPTRNASRGTDSSARNV